MQILKKLDTLVGKEMYFKLLLNCAKHVFLDTDYNFMKRAN